MKIILILILIIILVIFSDTLFPLSTITNYREDSIITFHLNRYDVNNASNNGILYNVEKQYGFLYIASWCPSKKYPCGG